MVQVLLIGAVGARFCLAGYLALRAAFGPALWPLCIVEPVLFWICLPSAVLLLAALARKKRIAALTHAFILAVWLATFGHVLVPPAERPPRSPAAEPGGRAPELSVLTFNVGAGLASYAELVALLRRESTDLVLIQELTADQARALAGDLLDLYPHRDLHGLGIEGLGALSKFPLLDQELFRIFAKRPYQRVVLDVRGEATTVFNVHPGLSRLLVGPWSPNAREFERLGEAAAQNPPALIVGDFNATENMNLCRSLERFGLRDAFRESGRGLGLTFPVPGKYHGLPLPAFVRIDFVWHTAAFESREARVLPDAGSDHYPLRVTLERTR